MVSRGMTLIGVVAIAVLAVAAILLAGGPPQKPSTKPVTVKLTEVEEERKEWIPSKIYLKKGDDVQLTVINGDDDDEHRFAIPELGVESEDIPPANGRVTLTFTAEKVGTFRFIDPLAPDWGSEECSEEAEAAREEPICIPPGEIIVEG